MPVVLCHYCEAVTTLSEDWSKPAYLCPHCATDVPLPRDQCPKVVRRPSSELAKGVALILITLATAAVGSYAAIRYFAYELAKAVEQGQMRRGFDR